MLENATSDPTNVIREEPWTSIRQTHAIEVQYPPVIQTYPEEGYIEVKKGEDVVFGCEAIGTPTPHIRWYKNGEELNVLNERNNISFKADDRTQGGRFVCRASNGVGDPVEAFITVSIEDAPKVTAFRSWVHTSPGLRASLEVKVESVPQAITHWYKNGQLVTYDTRVVNSISGDKHQLVFRNVRETDLGEYTFRAENPLGMADAKIKLTGVPNKALFKVEPSINKATATSFTLLWEVDSSAPIIEYWLWIRPYVSKSGPDAGTSVSVDKNPWKKIVVPAGEVEGPIHSCNYTLRGLTPSAVYEAMVTSKNRFGWSNPSAILHFATEPGVREQPSTFEYDEHIYTPIIPEEELDHSKVNKHIVTNNSDRNHANLSSLQMFLVIFISIFWPFSYIPADK